jgi:signal transduction histidine kinase
MRKRALSPRRRICRSLGPIVVTFVQLGMADSASAADRQKQVLVLYSTRRDAQIAIIGDRQLPRLLDVGLQGRLDYYSEFIDFGRFSHLEYQDAFRDFLLLKYRGQRFDLVIAMSDDILPFIEKNRSVLFPTAPVVFFAMTSAVHRIENSTGVIAELNLRDTLALANTLQPDLRNVFLITGADNSDKIYERAARSQLQFFEPRLKLSYFTGLATKDLVGRLAALPEHSIVYYLLVSRDGAGEYFHPLEYIDRVTAAANAPTYCWVDSTMTHGIVGGSLKSLDSQVEAIARLSLRVLRGEHADNVPVSTLNLNVHQVDWRQLRRWGISEARVPPGTLIRFREPTAWERYKRSILGVSALLLAETLLIACLLLQRETRRRAEARLRASQAELLDSYKRIRDLGGRLLNAQEDERSRIARELHDDVGQQLALLAIDLELIGGAGTGPLADTEDLTLEARNLVHGIVRSVHDLSHRLHPPKLRLIGLVAALDGLRREFSRPDLVVTFEHDNVPPALPHEIALCLFRVAQEALQNVVKHSGGREVSMQLIGKENQLMLTIADDGVGFEIDAVKGTGIGLISMNERLDAIGGTLTIRTRRGGGTRLDIRVPRCAAPASPASGAVA